jgi:hypothetical protein
MRPNTMRNHADNGVTEYPSTVSDAAWRKSVPSIAVPDAMTDAATPAVITDATIEAPSAAHRQTRA